MGSRFRQDAVKRRVLIAQKVLLALSAAPQGRTRGELFTQPETGPLREAWELRFLQNLEEQGVLERPFAQFGKHARWALQKDPSDKVLHTVSEICSNAVLLAQLVTSTKKTFSLDQFEQDLHGEEAEDEVEAEEDPPEPPPTQFDPLELIADRLVLVLEALVAIKQTIDTIPRVERKLDLFLKSMGIEEEKDDA